MMIKYPKKYDELMDKCENIMFLYGTMITQKSSNIN